MTKKENENMGLVNYRLEKIEETLAALKDVMLHIAKIDDRIAALDEKIDNRESAIASKLEIHIKHSAGVLDDIGKRITQVEERPMQERSNRWAYITDYLFKGVVAAVAAFLFMKIGLK